MASNTPEVDFTVSDLLKSNGTTMVVTVTGWRKFRIRLMLAMPFFWFAAKIVGVDIRFDLGITKNG